MSSYQNAKGEVERLVEKFSRDYQRFINPNYNEEQVRVEFITPFFRALGWDVENSLQVIHEDRVIVDEAGEKRVKHPDYGFRTGRDIRFYVEAKKPAVNLKNNSDPAYQIRRYGWSRGLPLSVLTDFEEFIIYNCLEKPSPSDKPHIARLRDNITYDKYLDVWDELYGVFSYEAVLDGALERYVDDNKPKGTVTVDTAFLQELEHWRELLAKDIALRNPRLTRRQLNIAVQRTIDRLVFLRITEDRNIEPYGRLNRIAKNRDDVYDGLKRLYAEANDKYNSGLFHFTDDDNDEVGDPVSLKIEISGDTLQSIITKLYYPYSPYEFSVLPSDILGQVYERFLGSVIVLDGGSANIEEKPEVRKAGGVFYTPTYIVDYIVENTIGKLVENKNPNQVAELRILDPACGSGSFLIGAYQYLLDWHLDYYVDRIQDNPNSTYKNRVRETDDPSQSYALRTDEKKRILLNNIYGVDLDQQAVEVSKLSLLLKMLENETATSTTQYAMFGTDEQLLPDLANNIKWGNSLIESDFYSGKQIPMFDEEEIYRVKAFDWNSDEGFGAIMRSGGFDAVIGNPPYLRIQGLQEYYANQVPYLANKYNSAIKRFDLYLLFTERGFELLSHGGYLGFICPHKFVNSDFGSGLREYLTENKAINRLISFGNNLVFQQASTYTGILILQNNLKAHFEYYEFKDLASTSIEQHLKALKNDIYAICKYDVYTDKPWILVDKSTQIVLDRLSQQRYTLADVTSHILVGVQSGIDDVHVVKFISQNNGVGVFYSEKMNSNVEIEMELVKPFLRGEDVHRFEDVSNSFYIVYPYELIEGKTKILEENLLFEKYPLGYKYLFAYKDYLQDIRERQRTNPQYWYSCHRSRDMNVFEKERIITPEISLGCNMTIVGGGMYHNTKVYSIVPSDECDEHLYYWLSILNSKLLWWYISNTGYVLRGGYYTFKTNYLKPFPIRTINFDKPDQKAQHDTTVRLVGSMLALHKQLPEVSGAQKRLIEQQITRTDREIDALVYELYELTDEEIAIVEEANK